MDTSSSIYFKTEDLVKFTKIAGTEGAGQTLRTVFPIKDNAITNISMKILQSKYAAIRYGLLHNP